MEVGVISLLARMLFSLQITHGCMLAAVQMEGCQSQRYFQEMERL